MRSLTIFAFLAYLAASTIAAVPNLNLANDPRAEAAEMKQRDVEASNPLLEDRAIALTKCPKSNGCTCKKGTKQGQVSLNS